MHYPQSTPNEFKGAKAFVEHNGLDVWTELCDLFPGGEWLEVRSTARQLPLLARYAQPERYLRAVLKAILADYRERPGSYFLPPFEVKGKYMRQVRV